MGPQPGQRRDIPAAAKSAVLARDGWVCRICGVFVAENRITTHPLSLTCGPTGYTLVEVGDFAPVLEGWLGPDHGLPVRYEPGTGPGIHACEISLANGEIVLR